jgi:RNA polymerase sigma-70 factor (ECF subfamily)
LQPSDQDLVSRAANGDDAAFHELVDRHAASLFRAALSMTRSRDDAEDVMQEALIGAHRGLKRFDGRSSVKTWLTSIVMRQAAKGWHKSRRSRETLSLHAASDEHQTIDDAAMGVDPSTADADTRMDLTAMLQRLSEDHRQIIVLREIQGLSYDEIANALNIPRGTVESRIHRARLELRERLKAYAPR